MPRFFIEKSDISENQVLLSGENMHHLINVLRCEIGEEVTVCDKCGIDYHCTLQSIEKDCAVLKIEDITGTSSEPSVEITLYQGLPKGDKLSYITEKSVEAGVFKIIPVSMKRSVVKLSKKDFQKKKERLLKVSLSAAKQSGRGVVPEIEDLIEFKDIIPHIKDYDAVIFPYENAKDVTLKSFIREKEFKKVAVIIGPEGGFSEEEAELLVNENVVPVTLGARILRTETAGIATIFNILYETEQ